jgi:ABC-2 type transport system permease protein
MLDTALDNARLYRRLIGVRIRAQMAYRVSFILDLLATAAANGATFLSLAAVFARFGNIGGWQLGEVAFLFGIAEISFALMDMIFTGYDPDFFSQQVRKGTLDQFMLRPVGLELQILTSEFLLRRLGRIVEGIVIFAIALRLAHVTWTFAKLLYLPIVIVSSIAFFGGIFIIGATICFWTVQSIEAVNIFTYGGGEMMSYPMHIYGDWLRTFFTFVVPTALLSYYPALYFLDKPDPLGLPRFMSFLSPIAGFGVLALAFAFWRFGLRHYQSTGT